jgi:pimeloyl-ACP methyl ester carboxylesterase
MPPRRASRRGSLLGRAALVAGLALALRTGLRIRRELAAFDIGDARLRSDWSVIPGFAGTDRLRIHARVGGPTRTTLPSIVLVHGYGIATNYLVPLAARLARHAYVYAPELPGHGHSDHDQRPLTIPELALALAAWLDEMQVVAPILVGHSMGCQIAAELAARRPDLASGLVLIGPTSDPAARTPAAQLRRSLKTAWHERPSAGLWLAADYARAGQDVLTIEMRELVSHRIERVLQEVRAPVRVVRGEHDHIVPQRWAEAVARLGDAPAPDVVPGWGHAVHYDEPDAVVKTVFALARSVRSAARNLATRDQRLPVHPAPPPAGSDDRPSAVS